MCHVLFNRTEYLFNFDDTFEIHDDIEVLKRMGMALGKSCIYYVFYVYSEYFNICMNDSNSLCKNCKAYNFY